MFLLAKKWATPRLLFAFLMESKTIQRSWIKRYAMLTAYYGMHRLVPSPLLSHIILSSNLLFFFSHIIVFFWSLIVLFFFCWFTEAVEPLNQRILQFMPPKIRVKDRWSGYSTWQIHPQCINERWRLVAESFFLFSLFVFLFLSPLSLPFLQLSSRYYLSFLISFLRFCSFAFLFFIFFHLLVSLYFLSLSLYFLSFLIFLFFAIFSFISCTLAF